MPTGTAARSTMALSGLFTETAGSTRSLTGEEAELLARHGILWGSKCFPVSYRTIPKGNPIVMIRHNPTQS